MSKIRLSYCKDCQEKLTDSNRSEHQPDIRCSMCWDIFLEGITKTLREILAILDK